MAEPFVCIGAMKSGTTTLYEILNRHPQVEIVAEKESSELRSVSTARRMAAQIARSSATVAGEVSTAYMQTPMHDQPIDRAVSQLGDGLRVVAILRDPFERAVSHWQHWVQLQREDRTIEEALLDPDGAYRAFSSYFRQLGPWLDALGKDKLLVLRLESYQADPARTSASLWDFLGVPVQADDDFEVHANAVESRVVAVGAGGRISRLPIYRLVRPLVPSSARRAVSAALGGTRNRRRATPTKELRAEFEELIAADAKELRAHWPELRWN